MTTERTGPIPTRPAPPPATLPATDAYYQPEAAYQPPSGTVVTPVPGGRHVTVRRARVAVTKVDPWSVMKLAFVLTVLMVLVVLAAITILWWVLDASGIFTQLNSSLVTITGSNTVQIQQLFSLGRVLTYSTLVGVIDIVLLTALATLGAFLFNLSTGLVGGVDVVLTETD
jgi:hypothetical protein